ncbi:ATP-binding protein [Jidongwangia harbinensis]|uniref:ATP-binding protein n=1 Tax=Jidongwangia harbinensis TaxID=2878561 RepID=UPI001CDA1992|nr:ATP-binding protein [Jidongwangia harbinensis]MCA2219090.1 ATP-binding protein [Jidongwangia harbinensis]
MDRAAQVDIVSGDTVRVVLAGTVLMVRQADVLSQVERTMKAVPCREVQVDLTEVTALDSSGVALLILTRRLAHRSGVDFRVRGASPEILQHLHLVGLTALFGLRPLDGGDRSASVVAGSTSDPAGTTVTILDEPFDRQCVGAIRGRLSSYATSCGLSGFDRYRLLLAATEIMANAVNHGGGRGSIRAEHRGDRMVLRITDHGPGIPRRHRTERPRPRPGRVGSSGLWLARHLCEQVSIDTGPAGTTVVLTYALPPRVE